MTRQPLAGLVMQRCVALADKCKNVGEVVGQMLLTETVTSHKRSTKGLDQKCMTRIAIYKIGLGAIMALPIDLIQVHCPSNKLSISANYEPHGLPP